MNNDLKNEQRTLSPIADYHTPAMPTDIATKRMIGWVWQQFNEPSESEPFIGVSDLDELTRRTLEDVVAPPACGPLLKDFDTYFQPQLAHPGSGPRLQLVLFPPGDRNDLLGNWAQQNGLEVLAPPDRRELLKPALDTAELVKSFNTQTSKVLTTSPTDLLVIPNLQRWFLRNENGLTYVRRLFDRLDNSDRHVIVGCNTWAWDFLCKATQSDLVLPPGLTLRPFGATELRDWFQTLEAEGEVAWKIRLASSGLDVFSEDASKSHYFEGLAAESLGIAWVAWHRWRNSLRIEKQTDRGEHALKSRKKIPEDERTLWVAPMPTLKLPSEHIEQATLVLQSLMIHGGLTVDELRMTVPIVGELRVVSSLIRAGFVRRDDCGLQIVPTAYPEIRRELVSDGFPHPDL